MKRFDIGFIVELGFVAVGCIGIGYGLKCRKEMKELAEKIDKSVDEIEMGTVVDVSEDIVEKAVNEAVAAALAPYKEREERTRLAALLQSNEKLKNVPEVFRSRYQLDKEENLDSVVEQINNDFTTMKQALVADGTFVSAPTTSTPQSEQDDFIKRMEGFAQRNAPKPEGLYIF